jgi:uncharacterized protein YukE
MKFDITHALTSIRPGAEWSMHNEDYQTLEWKSETSEAPTLEELNTEVNRLQSEWDAKEYQRNRAQEYPPMTDYLDALFWQTEGDESKMISYLAAVKAVKEKYPRKTS